MGLLNMSISNCNAPRKLTEPEQADIDAFLYLQPKYEAEIKSLITTDTLYLVDRKHVYTYKGYHISYDNTKVIPLTSKEKKTIADAFRKGTLGFSGNNDIVNYAVIPAFNSYLFVAGNTFILSYNYGIFRHESFEDYDITISNKWKRRVESILQKYCPDSFSQSEKYWIDKANEKRDEKQNKENLQ